MRPDPRPLFREPQTPRQHRYLQHLHRCDPPADRLATAIVKGRVSVREVDAALDEGAAATAATADFLAALEAPVWVDPERARLGCEAFQRTGILGAVVLSLYSLPLGYLSPAAVKPLTASGRLVESAPRRLAETNRFLVEVTTPGGMEPGAKGFRTAAKVRLMHAMVRQRLWRDWPAEQWGAPINQGHMGLTNLLFSLHTLDGLRKLGVRISEEEADGYLHLWRHVGYTVGVDPELLCSTDADGRRLWSLFEAMEGEPDQDCRDLARALVEHAVPRVLSSLVPIELSDRRFVRLMVRLCTALLGRDRAEALGLERQTGPLLISPLVRVLMGGVESVRRRAPYGRELMVAVGGEMNRRIADRVLDGTPAQFVA